MTHKEIARADVAFILSVVQPRLSAALGMKSHDRQAAAQWTWPGTPGPDGRSAAEVATAALREGSDRALGEAWTETGEIMAAARAAADSPDREEKTLLQSFAGSGAGALVIQGGSFAAGVQNAVGDPLGAAAGIQAEIAAGNDPEGIAAGGLTAGEKAASSGLGIAVAAVVVVGAVIVGYVIFVRP